MYGKLQKLLIQHLKDDWKFKAQTKDIMDINYIVDNYTTVKGNGDIEKTAKTASTIINTSCEHIENFDEWFAKFQTANL